MLSSPTPSCVCCLVCSLHLHCFWSPILPLCIWKGLQTFHLTTTVNVTGLYIPGRPWLWNGLSSVGVSTWQHWGWWFKNILFILYHLMCRELNLYRCCANKNWVWICCNCITNHYSTGSPKDQMFKIQV